MAQRPVTLANFVRGHVSLQFVLPGTAVALRPQQLHFCAASRCPGLVLLIGLDGRMLDLYHGRRSEGCLRRPRI